MRAGGSRSGLAFTLGLFAIGCRGPVSCEGAPPTSSEPPEDRRPTLSAAEVPIVDQLFVDPRTKDFSENPKLLDRILSGPHGYFRFVNVPFSQAVCRRLRTIEEQPPSVNLHGDAHLEQYAVTDIGRGLTDFDDSSKGPVVIDLLRFGTSLNLALRAADQRERAKPLFERFLSGYRDALADPEVEAPEPEWAAKVRAGFTKDREKYFAWIESIMKPVADEDRAQLEAGLTDYIEAMHVRYPESREGFFEVEEVGRLRMGIGSALDDKYLIRVAGPTDAPLDDVVLEVKEVRSLAGIECIEGAKSSDPFRILLAQSRIAYEPYAYLGYMDLDGRKFWIHSWVDNYRELSIETLADQPDRLREVVYDVGVQLGRGHPKIAGEFSLQLRQSLSKFIDKYQGELLRGVDVFSEATTEAWTRFRKSYATEAD